MSAHVTGDAGVDLVLDAVEAAGRVRPIEKSRFNLIHAYFPDASTGGIRYRVYEVVYLGIAQE